MDMNLYGKVALVSGCSQGLGYHAALALAKQGADIFGVSIGDDSSLKKAIEATGRNYHSFTISLTTPGAVSYTHLISSSLASGLPKQILSLMVPENNIAFCGMTPNFARRANTS